MNTYLSNGFLVGSTLTYEAQVKTVKDDAVAFRLTNCHQQELTGIYYLPSNCRINPHTIFKVGEFWQVNVNKITKRFRKKETISYAEMNIEVTPLHMPTDDFIAQHPVGSSVTGVVKHSFHSGLTTIYLDKEVECNISCSQPLKKGCEVLCKILRYNAKTKKINIEIV